MNKFESLQLTDFKGRGDFEVERDELLSDADLSDSELDELSLELSLSSSELDELLLELLSSSDELDDDDDDGDDDFLRLFFGDGVLRLFFGDAVAKMSINGELLTLDTFSCGFVLGTLTGDETCWMKNSYSSIYCFSLSSFESGFFSSRLSCRSSFTLIECSGVVDITSILSPFFDGDAISTGDLTTNLSSSCFFGDGSPLTSS